MHMNQNDICCTIEIIIIMYEVIDQLLCTYALKSIGDVLLHFFLVK